MIQFNLLGKNLPTNPWFEVGFWNKNKTITRNIEQAKRVKICSKSMCPVRVYPIAPIPHRQNKTIIESQNQLLKILYFLSKRIRIKKKTMISRIEKYPGSIETNFWTSLEKTLAEIKGSNNRRLLHEKKSPEIRINAVQ